MATSNKKEPPPRKRTDLQGSKGNILLSLAVIVIPMVILPALLLGLVFSNQVPATLSSLPGVFPHPQAKESSAFIIDFSASSLLTVATWISTVSSVLPPFAMVLVSYPVARAILNASKEKNTDDLPTPYQLSLLLGVLSGSIGSLWNWFKYRGLKKRERVNTVARGSIACLTSVSILSYLIVANDSWLHKTISTIQILQAQPSKSSLSTFGRGFYSSDCVDNTYPCSVSTGNHGTGLINGPEGFKTLANTSNQNLLLPFVHDGQSYVLITDANVPQDTGYQAQTFAVTTQCSLISQECGLNLGSAGSSPYNCSAEFSGDLTDFGVLSSNPSVQAPMAGGTYTPANPIYIGAYGLVPGFGCCSSPLSNSPKFLGTESQGLGFVLGCNMTAYDVEFVWYNGSISVQQMIMSNVSVVRVLTAPFVTKLANLATLAQTAVGEDTPQSFLQTWTTGFSTMVLGLSAGVMAPRTNIMEQTYVSRLVARVPKAPLIMLAFLSLLYAMVGIVLAFAAGLSRPDELKNVQGRLGVAGLAAKCFESQERCDGPAKEILDLFAEKEVGARDHGCSKVSIVASDAGGWKYHLITKDN